MKFLTDEHREQLLKNGSPGQRAKDHRPVVWLYIPFNSCKWMLTELDPENPHIAFGLCDLGQGYPELGYVDLEELEAAVKDLGTNIYHDIDFDAKHPISVYASAARSKQKITVDEAVLLQHVKRKPFSDPNQLSML